MCEGYGQLTFEKGTEVTFYISAMFDRNSKCDGIKYLYNRFKVDKEQYGKSFWGIVKSVDTKTNKATVKIQGVGSPLEMEIEHLEWNN